MTQPLPLTFGDIDDEKLPLAVLVHGFPDTPHTWRHLGPDLAGRGYRVVAPWLPGYGAPTKPVSAGTYVRSILDVRASFRADDRAVLVGHDWGANAGYGVVATDPAAFSRLVTLAVPPVAALGAGILSYAQLRRSFYVWFIQQVGLAETALLEPGFWESLWADWSPGYDPHEDVAELRRHVSPTMSPTSSAPTVRTSTRTSPTRPPRPRGPQPCSRRRCRRCTYTAPTTERSVRNCSATSLHTYRPKVGRSKSSTA